MAASGLGTKRECPKCSAKFYDLGANPIVCPKCGHSFKADAPKPAAKRASEPVKPKAKAKPRPAFKEEETLVDAPLDEDMDNAAEVGELEDLDELDDAPEVISLEEVEEHHEDAEADPNSDDAEDEMFMEDLTGDADLFDTLDPDAEADDEDDDEESENEEDEDDETPPKRKR